jgi:hypothetical protein
MSLRLTRRGFLAGLAAGVVGAAVGLRLYWSGARTPVGAERLASTLSHTDSAVRLGRRYLEGAPEEANAGRLIALIGTQPAGGESDAALRERLQTCIRQDFIDGTTVAVDGWLLSLTEARLCALVSLLQNTQPTHPV